MYNPDLLISKFNNIIITQKELVNHFFNTEIGSNIINGKFLEEMNLNDAIKDILMEILKNKNTVEIYNLFNYFYDIILDEKILIFDKEKKRYIEGENLLEVFNYKKFIFDGLKKIKNNIDIENNSDEDKTMFFNFYDRVILNNNHTQPLLNMLLDDSKKITNIKQSMFYQYNLWC